VVGIKLDAGKLSKLMLSTWGPYIFKINDIRSSRDGPQDYFSKFGDSPGGFRLPLEIGKISGFTLPLPAGTSPSRQKHC
jgi:hypothetical protein